MLQKAIHYQQAKMNEKKVPFKKKIMNTSDIQRRLKQ